MSADQCREVYETLSNVELNDIVIADYYNRKSIVSYIYNLDDDTYRISFEYRTANNLRTIYYILNKT